MSSEELLLVFVKNRQKGRVKTRLAASVGEHKALAIYNQLLRYTRNVVRPLTVDLQVWYSEYIPLTDIWDDLEAEKRTQVGADLGERMHHAFKRAFREGYRRVVIIGSDCAELTTSVIRTAFNDLETSDVAIGPSSDGGYYLLGMSRLYGELFEGKAWSTPSVYRQTVEEAEELGLEVARLEELTDVDTVDDWQQVKSRFVNTEE
ncbi:MAG: TIGR04282 family arsenosugar biosynthesis glycosyltransferase [Balneolaceae bacterium]|nr:TIGR04282 family arsenosugar biosynthesis glycosyltransferase [Balneolaceae bacterium]